VRGDGGCHVGFCNPYSGGHDLFRRARCCAGTGYDSKRRSSSFARHTSKLHSSFANCSKHHSSFPRAFTPVTSTVTNCMMLCNSQSANCHTACVIPAAPTTAGAFNATANVACVMGCTSSQLACHTNCSLLSAKLEDKTRRHPFPVAHGAFAMPEPRRPGRSRGVNPLATLEQIF
jgi:hypothetical protein